MAVPTAELPPDNQETLSPVVAGCHSHHSSPLVPSDTALAVIQ
jgi:hypothetical protein